MKIYDRLKEWGMMLPELAPTNGFLCVKLIDGFAFISGHAPFDRGRFVILGD